MTPADHATHAAFWQFWLAQLESIFISRVPSGVVGMLKHFQTFLLKRGGGCRQYTH
jgi:hypothetical protein